MSLGAGETNLVRLTAAYAALVNGGKAVTPSLYDRVQNRYGETLVRRDTRACEGCDARWQDGRTAPPRLPDTRTQILDPVIAYQSVSMLEGVVLRGTAQRIRAVTQATGIPVAGKTGTTNDYMDGWFVGFSPNLAVGIWVGFDTTRSLGRGESGGRVATPIFRDFMLEALQGSPDAQFRMPQGVRLVEVDARTGRLPDATTTATLIEAFQPGTEPRLGAGPDQGDFSISGSGTLPGGLPGTDPSAPPGETPPGSGGLDPVY
jgi:penicillin-binding protein 1A